MNDHDDAWSLEPSSPPGTTHTIQGGDTLEHVARQAAQFLDLTPINTERFVGDWLSEWAERGFPAEATVAEVQAGETGGWVWDRLCSLVSRYADYHTDQQLADFILYNLFRITNTNVLRAFTLLAERSDNEEAQRFLRSARRAVEVLDQDELSGLLHQLAQPS